MEIPTKKVKIGEKEIEVYKWMTQDQEDEYLSIMTEGKEYTIDSEGNTQLSVSARALSNSRKYKVESLCKSLSWEEFNNWSPEDRSKLLSVLEKDKKK